MKQSLKNYKTLKNKKYNGGTKSRTRTSMSVGPATKKSSKMVKQGYISASKNSNYFKSQFKKFFKVTKTEDGPLPPYHKHSKLAERIIFILFKNNPTRSDVEGYAARIPDEVAQEIEPILTELSALQFNKGNRAFKVQQTGIIHSRLLDILRPLGLQFLT